MDFRRFFCFCIISCATLINTLYGQELLKNEDVNKVMQQIFAQHVDQRQMSPTILKHAFRVYIDQFDPLRVYLLEDEVKPYIDMPDAKLNTIVAQYKNQDYSPFTELNTLFQKAILRARQLRGNLETQPAALFSVKAVQDKPTWVDEEAKAPFAKTENDLKLRIRERLEGFIAGEKTRYGEEAVMDNQAKTLAIFNRYLTKDENSYLFVTEGGKPMALAQQENIFILHILKALAASLDAHTSFYDNNEAYDMKVRLQKAFEGIGVVLEQDPSGAIVISKLVDGGPAAKSGEIQAQDKIIAIDGQSTKDSTLNQVMDMIRGQNGSKIALSLARASEKGSPKLVDVTLKREPIEVNDERVNVSYEKFGDGIIGKITLYAFYQGDNGVTSENDVRKALVDLSKKGPIRGLILDLRENSGGFLTQAVKVVGLFIRNGVVVISKYSDGREHFYRDMEGRDSYEGPMVVLVSKATASAAEIVAQALQDYGVAVVIGDEHTYGKGTIQSQTVTDSEAASYFKVTVGKYYTVSGKTPQINGVKSDVVIPGPFSEEKIGEKYLEFALSSDTIPPEYKDDLSDVDPGLKPWYLRYYLPTLQPRVTQWDSLIPTLKKNSNYRVEHNKYYQAFLRQLKGLPPDPADIADEELQTKAHNYNGEELQMAEAVNIVKDMIMLEPKVYSQTMATTQATAGISTHAPSIPAGIP